jgi:hypothetical protein
MTEYNPDVIFNAGEPLDVNKLNQIQRNVTSVFQSNINLSQSTNQTIGNLQKEVKVFPIVEIGSIVIETAPGACRSDTVPFKNKAFTDVPIIVASIASDINKDSAGLTIRASTSSTAQGRIEVCSSDKLSQKVTINYIAIQMKEIE